MSILIPRSEWGSTFDYAARHAVRPASPAKVETCLHHSDTLAPDLIIPWDDEYAAMRLLERIGVERFQSGMSYNVAVMPSGNAYAGQPLDNKATHSGYQDWNYTRASIVLVGNYNKHPMTDQAVAKVAEIQAAWFKSGTIANLGLRWHGQVQETSCPGLNARIAEIDRAARDLEDDMALFANKGEFRNEVRLAVEAEMNDQWPTRTAETVAATVEALRPLLPLGIDTEALVARIVAKVNRPLTVVREESYRVIEA